MYSANHKKILENIPLMSDLFDQDSVMRRERQ
jgi:hypothetical protein